MDGELGGRSKKKEKEKPPPESHVGVGVGVLEETRNYTCREYLL